MTPILLVHGAWHGAWCFAALQAELDRRGLPSYAIDLPGHAASTLPLGDLYGDAQHVVEALAAIGDEVVLVGHSYGGAVVTEAAVHAANIRHLVYLTAFALEEGESVLGLLGTLPREVTALGVAMQTRDDGTSFIDPAHAAAAFYGHCPPAVAAASIARLCPQLMSTFLQPVTGSPRRTIPSTYVRCTEDDTIHINHQDHMAPRCNEVVTIVTDHSPFASAVSATADVLERIATA